MTRRRSIGGELADLIQRASRAASINQPRPQDAVIADCLIVSTVVGSPERTRVGSGPTLKGAAGPIWP